MKTISLILLLPTLLFSQTIQQRHSSVIARMNLAVAGVDSTPVLTPTAGFTAVTDAALGSYNTSNGVALSAFDSAYAYAAGDSFKVGNLGTLNNIYVRVFPNDTIYTAITASGTNSTDTLVILTMGTVLDTFTVTTVAGGGATPFATFDFEASSGWTADGTTGSRSTTVAHASTYSWACTGVGDDYEAAYLTITARDSAYATFYIYYPIATTVTTGYSYLVSFDDGTTGTDGDRSIFGGNITGGAGTPWDEWAYGINSGDMSTGTTNFATNAWRKIKIFYNKGTGVNGQCKVWIGDGSDVYTKVLDVSNGTGTSTINSFVVGIRGVTLTGNVYIDDINLYDEDPG